MKSLFVAVMALFIYASIATAQISIDTITTDTVDVFNQSTIVTTNKLNSGALWSSLLIPGVGHQMVNRPVSALAYLTVDFVSLFGTFFLLHLSKETEHNAQSFAELYAGVGNNITSTDYFWQTIGNFDSYHDYHTAYKTDFREISDKFTDEKYFWAWQDSSLRNDYVTLQKRSKQFSTLSSFCIGAMVLNRLVAFIDLRSMSKNKTFKQVSSSLSFMPLTKYSANGISILASF